MPNMSDITSLENKRKIIRARSRGGGVNFFGENQKSKSIIKKGAVTQKTEICTDENR
jgi:hypothetical protein